MLPISQLSPNEYEVQMENEEVYRCKDSSGIQSNTYVNNSKLARLFEVLKIHWNPRDYNSNKSGEDNELIIHHYDGYWNSTEDDVNDNSNESGEDNELIIHHYDGHWNSTEDYVDYNSNEIGEDNEQLIIHHSDGQKSTTAGLVNGYGVKMNRPPLTLICPAQKQKDYDGVERYWPAIKLDSIYYYNNGKCVEAARKCSWNSASGLHLIEPPTWNFHNLTQCPIRDVNLTQAAHDLQNIAKKEVISTTDIQAATSLVNQALQMNHSVLSTGHQDVGSIVRSLDAVLTRVHLAPGQNVTDIKSQVAIFVLNVQKQPPVAVALENSGSGGNLLGSSLRIINSEEDIASSKVDVAVLLPHSITAQNSHIAFAIFSDDSAFQDPVHKTNSRVVSINLVGTPKLQNDQYVDIVFRPWAQMGNKYCVFWNFSLSGGAWSGEGCELLASAGAMYDVCRCSHLTHFAEIISPPGMEMDPFDRDVLDIISVIGCSLSLAGLFGIFFTGAAFRQWRVQLSNKILLHLSAAVSLNMLAFLVIATGLLRTHFLCIALGTLLHYSVLVSFCWMLVSAGLQFMRLVNVFGSHPISHLLLKASVFAWGAPLIPVTVLLAVDSEIYAPNGREFCYPGGLAFYLAVLCPVLIIVTANLIVFGMILQHVFRGSAIRRHMQSERKFSMRRVATSVLLFFLLGLSWLFGLLASLSTLCAYMFCITATLQGFVLFLFFILGEKKSRQFWTHRSTTPNVTTSTSGTPAERATLRQRDEITHL